MRKNITTLKFKVTLEAPKGATINDVQAYISAAVRSHCGSLHPSEDPMFELNRDTVKVAMLERKTTYA